MPSLGRTLVGSVAYALNRIEYLCPRLSTISRCRTWASHALVPLFSTRRQNAPFSTEALPSAGALNEVVQGRLVPSANVAFLIRFVPFAPLSPAGVSTGALAVVASQAADETASQPTSQAIDPRLLTMSPQGKSQPYVAYASAHWVCAQNR